MAELLFKDESYKIIGLCMEIHHTLGMKLKEINYNDAMEIEFNEHKIPFEREKRFTVIYKGKELRNPYLADFMVYDSIILEIKSATSIMDAPVNQALSYLSGSQQKLGMVINYGEKSLTWKRIIF